LLLSALPGASGRPLALLGFLPVWDIERRRADLSAIARWTREQIQRLGVPIGSLETLHQHLDGLQARALAQALTAASLARELRQQLTRVMQELLPEVPLERVWIQTHTHFRILLPGDELAPVPPHTDYGLGHSLRERNLWCALTDAAGDAALHVLPLRDSLSWLGRADWIHGALAAAPEIPPVPARAGEVLLFTPLHLHRARPPTTAQSRVSIDLRLIPLPEPGTGAVPDFSFSPLPRPS
jgi:hypothetical protein